MDDKTLFWLAGLFEGEAHFGRGTPSQPRHPRIALDMTDEDIVARVAALFDHTYTPVFPKNDRWSTTYKFTMRGTPAAQLMKRLYLILGKRRQGQIDRALENYVYDPLRSVTQSKITEADVREIKRRIAKGETAKRIAQDFPISHYAIWDIRSGKTWGQVSIEENRPMAEAALPDFPPPAFTEENNFHWIAGILEGEGSFMAGAPSEPNRPRIAVAMTDEDIIARVSEIVAVPYNALASRSEDHKNVYRVMIRSAQAIEVMKRLYPLMGKRRQGQIDRVIQSYRDTPHNQGDKNANAKISDVQAREIKLRLQNRESVDVIAADFNVSVSLVREIKAGRTWRHIVL